MIKPLVVRQPRSWIPVAVALAFSPIAALQVLPLDTVTTARSLFPALLLLITVVMSWLVILQGARQVRLSLSEGTVTVEWRSFLYQPRCLQRPLDDFEGVVSYITHGRFSRCRVELVSRTRSEGLLLAVFHPQGTARSFFHLPTEGESSLAGQLRASVVEQFAVRDLGYVGTRDVGKQVRDEA